MEVEWWIDLGCVLLYLTYMYHELGRQFNFKFHVTNEFTYLKNFLITGSSYVTSGGVCVPK